MKGDLIAQVYDGHNNETVTLTKHVTKGMTILILMRKNRSSNFSENLRVAAIKLFELPQFASPNPLNLAIYLILYTVEVRYEVNILKLTASAQFIYRKYMKRFILIRYVNYFFSNNLLV